MNGNLQKKAVQKKKKMHTTLSSQELSCYTGGIQVFLSTLFYLTCFPAKVTTEPNELNEVWRGTGPSCTEFCFPSEGVQLDLPISNAALAFLRSPCQHQLGYLKSACNLRGQ